jgi:hypothetical protein
MIRILLMPVHEEDYIDALHLLAEFDCAIIGGSYVVDPVKANDIDIVIPDWAFRGAPHPVRQLLDLGYKYMSTDKFDKTRYGDPTMIATYRKKNSARDDEFNLLQSISKDGVNVVVCRSEFYAAYLGPIREMQANPEKYQTRDQRVELHEEHRQYLRHRLRWDG